MLYMLGLIYVVSISVREERKPTKPVFFFFSSVFFPKLSCILMLSVPSVMFAETDVNRKNNRNVPTIAFPICGP